MPLKWKKIAEIITAKFISLFTFWVILYSKYTNERENISDKFSYFKTLCEIDFYEWKVTEISTKHFFDHTIKATQFISLKICIVLTNIIHFGKETRLNSG